MKRIFGKILIFISVLLLFTHVFSDSLVHFAFNLNEKYIQTELCALRDSLNNTCLGKCYLTNQVEKNQERKESPEFQNNKQDFYITSENNTIAFSYAIKSMHAYFYIQRYSPSHKLSLLRPPILS